MGKVHIHLSGAIALILTLQKFSRAEDSQGLRGEWQVGSGPAVKLKGEGRKRRTGRQKILAGAGVHEQGGAGKNHGDQREARVGGDQAQRSCFRSTGVAKKNRNRRWKAKIMASEPRNTSQPEKR